MSSFVATAVYHPSATERAFAASNQPAAACSEAGAAEAVPSVEAAVEPTRSFYFRSPKAITMRVKLQ